MDQSANTQKPKRQSNATRSAITQDKIINAAIQCIYDVGYEGTSIQSVADRAEISKGATQHHFPSKASLMLAVADYCLNEHKRMRLTNLSRAKDMVEGFKETAATSWEIINHPSYIALIEIMMATRNNQELKEGFDPLVTFIENERKFGVETFQKVFNVKPTPLIETMIRTHVTVMRGIAVGLMFNKDREGFRQELELLGRYEAMIRDEIIKEYGNNDN